MLHNVFIVFVIFNAMSLIGGQINYNNVQPNAKSLREVYNPQPNNRVDVNAASPGHHAELYNGLHERTRWKQNIPQNNDWNLLDFLFGSIPESNNDDYDTRRSGKRW